jgi:hypothetical protein
MPDDPDVIKYKLFSSVKPVVMKTTGFFYERRTTTFGN